MPHNTQLLRYKKLLQFIEENLSEEISITEIEAACHYSYRNINRIFQALHHESIGQFVKRLRLERAAQYLCYSEAPVTEISHELGFGDPAAFSKAFKKRFGCSPSAYRDSKWMAEEYHNTISATSAIEESTKPLMPYTIEKLPAFEILAYEYRGDYEDTQAIKKHWSQLVQYAEKENFLQQESIYLAEILDDDMITETSQCRYVAGIVVDFPENHSPQGLFIRKTITEQSYAKFIHKGAHESTSDSYQKIFASWMYHIPVELADGPILEFYLTDESTTPPEEMITEIYIPIEAMSKSNK